MCSTRPFAHSVCWRAIPSSRAAALTTLLPSRPRSRILLVLLVLLVLRCVLILLHCFVLWNLHVFCFVCSLALFPYLAYWIKLLDASFIYFSAAYINLLVTCFSISALLNGSSVKFILLSRNYATILKRSGCLR